MMSSSDKYELDGYKKECRSHSIYNRCMYFTSAFSDSWESVKNLTKHCRTDRVILNLSNKILNNVSFSEGLRVLHSDCILYKLKCSLISAYTASILVHEHFRSRDVARNGDAGDVGTHHTAYASDIYLLADRIASERGGVSRSDTPTKRRPSNEQQPPITRPSLREQKLPHLFNKNRGNDLLTL